MFHFDPSAAIQKELKPGINLTDLEWPSAIKRAVRAVEVASKAMFVIYCIGAGAVGVALIGAFWGLIRKGRLAAIGNNIISLFAFLALGFASAIASAVMAKVVSEVNQHGNKIGIAATKGNTFLGMTWAATILMLIAALGWIYEFIGHKHRHTSYVRDGKEGRY
ncbi:MAG: hypothetical protein Q9167_007508 [Letrouitia subvulpina]